MVMAVMMMSVIVRVMVEHHKNSTMTSTFFDFFHTKLYHVYTVISVTYIKAKCLRIPTVCVLPFIYVMAKYCGSRMDRNTIRKQFVKVAACHFGQR